MVAPPAEHIRNSEALLSHGNVAGRRVVLGILGAGLAASDPYPEVQKIVRVLGNKLVVGRVVGSVDSDGSDRPTDQAGAIADGLSMGRAAELRVDLFDELHHHNSSAALRRLGDTFYTGVRGTNVEDLRVVCVS